MEWVNTIQPIMNGDVYDKKHTNITNSFAVSYPHINYSLYAGAVGCSLYNELEFNNQSVNAALIASSINNYDIVSDLGEESIRKTVGEAYEKWVLEDTCNLDTYEDTNTFLNSYISELGSSYKDIASSTDYTFYVGDDMKVFQKELKNYNDLSLEYIAFMPRNTSLDKYIKNIDIDELNTYISKLKSIELNNFEKGYVTKIKGLIPLFEFDYELNLQDDLEKLGITDVSMPNHAKLTNITKDNAAYISSVNHKANITFSNGGIKATATSGGGYGDMGCDFEYLYDVPVKEIDITFDKPYIFLIRDKDTKEVWFTGSVYEPTLHDDQHYCAE